jgi:hypothetical protein
MRRSKAPWCGSVGARPQHGRREGRVRFGTRFSTGRARGRMARLLIVSNPLPVTVKPPGSGSPSTGAAAARHWHERIARAAGWPSIHATSRR